MGEMENGVKMGWGHREWGEMEQGNGVKWNRENGEWDEMDWGK